MGASLPAPDLLYFYKSVPSAKADAQRYSHHPPHNPEPLPLCTILTMGGGLFFLITGGFIGYHCGKQNRDRSDRNGRQGWSWCDQRSGPAMTAPVAADNEYKAPPYSSSDRPSTSDANALGPQDYAAYHAWKQEQTQAQGVAAPRLTAEALRAGAVENADRALDAILAQIHGLKEKLASQRGPLSQPAVPATAKSG